MLKKKCCKISVKEEEAWLDENQNCDADVYNGKLNDFHSKIQPIMSKIQGGEPEVSTNEDTSGPIIDEVD